MQQLSFDTLIAVFEALFGSVLFWSLVIMAAAFAAGFVYVVVRDRGLSTRRFLVDEILAIAGGFVAILFVQMITSSGFSDVGGPIDVIVLAGIWLAGAIVSLIGIYTLQALLLSRAR